MKELDIQRACMDWVKLKRNQDSRYWQIFAIPNGGKRGAKAAAQAKAEGILKGVSDIIIFCPSGDGRYHGAALELKAPDGKLRPAQAEFLERSHCVGMLARVIRSFDDFQKVVEGYFRSG